MSAFLAPLFGAGWQGFDNQGNVLAGGKLYTYQAGTTSPYATWSDFGLTIPNGNPIILNSAGRPSSEIWFDSSSYKVVLTDTNNNIIGTWDNLVGMGSGSPGPQGNTGPQGPQGFTGAQGPLGFGPSGTDGMDGDDGQPILGPKGNPGAQGVQGLTGPYNMPGVDGVDGDDGMQIPGGVGPQGTQGPQGPQGFTGAQGPLGFGPSGTDGMDGDDGMQIPGGVGPQGTQGPQGPQGGAGTLNYLSQSSNLTLVNTNMGNNIVIQPTTDISLTLPAANTLSSNQTWAFIKNTSTTYGVIVYDNAGTYLFSLAPQTGYYTWAYATATAAGSWTTQQVTTDYVGTPTLYGNTASYNQLYGKVVAPISSTQAVQLYSVNTNLYAVVVTNTSGVLSYGTPTLISNGCGSYVSIDMLSSTLGIVIFGGTGSVTPTAVTISISGTTITANTPLALTGAGTTTYGYVLEIAALSSTAAIIVCGTAANCASILTVSGTTLSQGSSYAIGGVNNIPVGVTALSATKIALIYTSTTNVTNAATATISGTTITLNTPLNISPAAHNLYAVSLTALSATSFAAFFTDNYTNYLQAFTVAGTVVTSVSQQTIASSNASFGSITALSSTSGIVTYQNSSSVASARAFTVTGGVLTQGSANALSGTLSLTNSYVCPFQTPAIATPSASTAYASTDDAYILNTGQVITSSGSTISSVGTVYTVQSSYIQQLNASQNTAAALSSSLVISLSYEYNSSGSDVYANLWTVSSTGTTLTQKLLVNSAGPVNPISITALSSTQAAVVYSATGTNYLTAVIITYSGGTISLGTPVALDSTGNALYATISALSSTSCIVGYIIGTTQWAIAFTVSGSTITAGTSFSVSTNNSTFFSCVGLSSTLAVISYSIGAVSITTKTLQISGTTITLGSTLTAAATHPSVNYIYITAVSPTRIIVASTNGSPVSTSYTYNNMLYMVDISPTGVPTQVGNLVFFQNNFQSLSTNYSYTTIIPLTATKGIIWSESYFLTSFGYCSTYTITNNQLNINPSNGFFPANYDNAFGVALQSPAVASPNANQAVLFSLSYGPVTYAGQVVKYYSKGSIN